MSSETDSFRPLASVVFLGIPGFADKPVTEQVRLRIQVMSAVAAAAIQLNESDRIILDTADGAAIVVLGNPPAALQAAQRALDAAVDVALGAAINHGPVRLAADERNDSLLIGDGIDAAVSIAGFVRPGQLLVSRSFHDALAEHTPALAEKFHRASTITDAHHRAHELFTLDVVASRAQTRRRVALAAFACVGILALGIGARYALQSLVESRQPAFLVFDIRPQGDIFVDGVMKGRAPAVTRLQVAAGTHTIEVRNGKFPSFVIEVDLSPGEQLQVKHSFTAPATQKRRGVLERLKFWR